MKKTYSVVIPVYNQFDKLDVVLYHFSKSEMIEDVEIIIIDDGSSDMLQEYTAGLLKAEYSIANLEVVHQQNQGRSAARNRGILCSQGDYLIFCDGDRIPSKRILAEYKEASQYSGVIVGGSLDCFMPAKNLYAASDKEIERMSRYGQYYKKVCEDLFDAEGKACSNWAWLGFLVGNSCVKKEIILDAGGFSLEFHDWGFEHFELAYRIMRAGYSICNDKDIKNYHIVHKRPDGFYDEKIAGSIKLLSAQYGLDQDKLNKLFLSKDIKEKYNFRILDKGDKCYE